jgi:DNA-binding transcriptional regulator YiaG
MTGDDIKAIRESLEMSQVQFAYLLGCRQHHISRWESGEHKPQKKWSTFLAWIDQHKDDPEMQAAIENAKIATM